MMRVHIIAMVTWQISKPLNELLCLQPHHFLLSFSGNYVVFFLLLTPLCAYACVRRNVHLFKYVSICKIHFVRRITNKNMNEEQKENLNESWYESCHLMQHIQHFSS